MKKSFEIPVYNSVVRDAVRNKQDHPNFEADWAETHFILVRAHTADEAVTICRRKHPEKMGFVLGEATEAH